MATTVRVRREWAAGVRAAYGDLSTVSSKVGVNKSTISRQFSGHVDAGPKFIAAVLTAFPVKFEDAFEVLDVADTPEAIVTLAA